MKILALETSTKKFSLAIAEDNKVLLSKNTKLKKVLSSSIIPSIKKLLDQARVPLSCVDGFAVGLGPGSFTSLRVGLATVKGLCLAMQKPVVGIGSLDLIAMNAKVKSDEQICVLCDAKRNLLYACFYVCQKGELKRTSDYMLADIQEIMKKVEKDTHFIGDGIKLFEEEIKKAVEARRTQGHGNLTCTFAKEKDWYPQARHLAFLAHQRFQKKQYDRADQLIPLYLYPDDCQIKR
ncbi:MAG: tRNA (adenosine(37)-N6)-threonylcarbamoyltransferase complex dimerization subunit type 1 TsaB [Candidatus Omnitrophota bacterium]